SGEPIAGATVQLHAEKTGREPGPGDIEFYNVKTGADGRFAISNVLPGQYRLIATRNNSGYVPAEYGQRSPTSEGIPFTVAAGQKMTGVRLEMAATGSIAGQVFDRDGEPVSK